MVVEGEASGGSSRVSTGRPGQLHGHDEKAPRGGGGERQRERGGRAGPTLGCFISLHYLLFLLFFFPVYHFPLPLVASLCSVRCWEQEVGEIYKDQSCRSGTGKGHGGLR